VPETEKPSWTFVTNHAVVLLCIDGEQGIRVRDIAAQVGITERATQRILTELVDAGYITKTRVGRRNTYKIDQRRRLRHPLAEHQEIGKLLALLAEH
jgi:DNA-binding MarR family transcriptional regulator